MDSLLCVCTSYEEYHICGHELTANIHVDKYILHLTVCAEVVRVVSI